MDSNTLVKMIAFCPDLKFIFHGVYPRDCLIRLPLKSFQIVNTDPLGTPGEHWLLLCRLTDGSILFYDSFARNLATSFTAIYKRIRQIFPKCTIRQLMPSHTFQQPDDSSFCGLYCIFMAQFIFSGKLGTFPPYATEEDLLRFMSSNFGKGYPRRLTYL